MQGDGVRANEAVPRLPFIYGNDPSNYFKGGMIAHSIREWITSLKSLSKLYVELRRTSRRATKGVNNHDYVSQRQCTFMD